MVQKVEWTEKRLQILRGKYQTMGPTRLAEEMSIPYFAVIAKARRMGIGSTRRLPPKEFEWTEALEAEMKERYPKVGGRTLAEEWGLFIGTVQKKAKSLGLKTKAGYKVAGLRKEKKSVSCDIHYFENWSAQMAYTLGFLFADGNINKQRSILSINLAKKDETAVRHIREELKSTHKLRFISGRLDSRTGNVNQGQVGVSIASTYLVKSLEALGMKARKTFNNDPFPKIPKVIQKDFIRGYFDGDGCVSIYKDKKWLACSASFVGSINIIEGIHTVLTSEGMSARKIQVREGKTCQWCAVAWTAKEDLKKFYKFIYPEGHGFCLERKKAKLVEWLNKNS